MLTETGLVGLCLLGAVFIGWTRCGWQLVRDPRGPPAQRRLGALLLGLLGIAFFQMIGHEITFTTLDNSLIYLVAGLAVGARAKRAAGVEAPSYAQVPTGDLTRTPVPGTTVSSAAAASC